jgi:hypothetical protein
MSAVVTELYDALRNAGAEETMARHAAEAVLGAPRGVELATKAEVLATKAELVATQTELRAEMQELRADMQELRHELKAEIQALRVELKSGLEAEAAARQIAMSSLTAELIKWNVGAMAALTAIFAAIVRFS